MIAALAIVFTLACFALMFLVNPEYKLAIMFLGTMVLSLVTLPIKGLSAIIILSLGFVLSEAKNWRIHWARTKGSILLPYVILVAVVFVLAVLTSPHLHNINDFGYFALSEVVVKYMSFAYGFLALRKRKSIKPIIDISFWALIFMTIIGAANLITGRSIYVQAFYNGPIDFWATDRFRVQATFANPFDYGFMCVLLALIHLYGYLNKLEDIRFFVIAQACSLFGVITCNCRTILFCYGICILVYVICLQKDKTDKLKIACYAAALAVIAFLVFPSARTLLLGLASIFDPDSTVEGSSINMRLIQLGTVIYYIKDLPYLLIGRGINFFWIDLGWENGASAAADQDLYGLEGVHMGLLLERGIMGLGLYLALMVLVLSFIIRHRYLGRNLYALGLSIFLLYILFSFMTGELLSFTPSFYILGYVIAVQGRREKIVANEFSKCPA